MKKLTADDPATRSADVVADNIEQLRKLFPDAFSEGKIDFEALKQLVGGELKDREEKFGLNWNGKRRARQLALTPSTGTLRPSPQDSVEWDSTKNLMIEGDNLEVLKLLQKSYSGEVKLIYIDPPYNTGNDFVYPDDFQDNVRNYLELTKQVEGGKPVFSNKEVGGRFHTNWLNMLYPRLRLARNLLSPDGVIFITIDDREVAHLRMICDEIFGEENFVANVVWQKKYAVANDDPGIGVMHDHIIVYRRSEAFARGLLPRTDAQNARYSNPDEDPRGEWASDNYVSNKSKEERPTLWYPIKHPRTGQEVWPDEHAVWRYSIEKHLEMERENRLYWGPDQSYKKPRLKRYLQEVQQGIVPPTWWTFEDCGHNDEAQKETAALLGRKVFSTPKPLRLIERMLMIGAPEGGIVLDFFAGSGATGHAVLARNASDGKDRRYILVQLPEPLSEDDKDQKVAAEFCKELGRPQNIAVLTEERLRRASAKIKEEFPAATGDLGFRVLRLDSTNIREWEPVSQDLSTVLQQSVEHLKNDRSEADILCELMLKLGLDLCVPIETRIIANKNVHSVGAGTLIVCLATAVAAEDVEALAKGIVAWHAALAPAGETTFVFRDGAFADDMAKTNLAAILQQSGLTNVRSL